MSAPGFSDPVYQSQTAFRAVLDAMARPGRLYVCGQGLLPPPPLTPAAAAVLLALADYESPLWVSPVFAGEPETWLRFHTGAPAAEPQSAAFALLDLVVDPLELSAYAQGSPDYPDRSTTLIAQVADFLGGGALHLSGPGIQGEARLGFAPMPSGFVEHWRQNAARYPLGIDLILASGETLAALPRSARITEAR